MPKTVPAAALRPGPAFRIAILCIAALGVSACGDITYPDWWPAGQTGAERSGGSTAATAAPRPDRSVAEAQRMLARLGYDPGPADGVLGRRSKAAIAEYRRDRGLPPGDKVDADLLDHLQSEIRKAERRRTITYRAVAQHPLAETGDVYVYSDGTVETVLRRAGPRVWWRAGDGSEYLAHANFLLPRWRRTGSGAEPPRIDADAEDLWPAPGGSPVIFHVAATDPATPSGESASPQEWNCAAHGKRRIEVPAGQIDTLVIACRRTPAPADQWQQRTWYYSPALGHFVRREDRLAGGARGPTLDLVAIRPGGAEWPPAARAGLDWALEQALQNGPDAGPTTWKSSGVEDFFVIRVTGDSASELGGGGPCLSYIQERFPEQRHRVYAGLACRDPVTGSWTLPFLGPATPSLIPTSR